MYRSTDAGETWSHVGLEKIGRIGRLVVNPTDPAVAVACAAGHLYAPQPERGVYSTTDGGATWEQVLFVDEKMGCSDIAMDPTNPRSVLAGMWQMQINTSGLVSGGPGSGVYRSKDSGTTWEKLSDEDKGLPGGESHPLGKIAVAIAQSDPDRWYVLTEDTSPGFYRSTDGGDEWKLVSNNQTLNERAPYYTRFAVSPDDADRIYIASVRFSMSVDGGESIVENPPRGGGDNHDVAGCESGWATPDPEDDNIVWSGCYDGGLERYDWRSGQWRDVRVWPEASYGWAPAEVKYRWCWNFPLHISPHNHEKVYVGSQHVHVTTDAGQSWRELSPDLTTNDKTRQEDSGGGLTIDNLYTFDGSVLFSIAESPVEQGVIWTGSVDGQVHVLQNGGESWTNVSKNIESLYVESWVKAIEPSCYDGAAAYIAFSNHQDGDFAPYIYKTTDYGESFERISEGIPESVFRFVHVVREDPERRGMLYAGTDNQVYVTLDDGEHWTSLRTNMPPAPIYWLTVQEHFSDLVVATYGRGFYILDDLTPLRVLELSLLEKDVHLFEPRAAYRFRATKGIKTESGSQVSGQNPPYGASIHYHLVDKVDDDVKIEIVDAAGETIRELEASGSAGLQRVWWDLRHEKSREAKLRTPLPEHDWVPLGEEGWRRLRTWDLDLFPGYRGPLAVPGMYTVRLLVGDDVTPIPLEVPLELRKDPHSTGIQADIEAQAALSLEIRDQLNEVVDMIDELEWTRKELLDLVERYGEREGMTAIVSNAEELSTYAVSVEGKLFDVNLTGAREDAFRAPMKLYGRLGALGNDLGHDSADLRPTDQQLEVHAILTQRLDEVREEDRKLIDEDVPAFRKSFP